MGELVEPSGALDEAIIRAADQAGIGILVSSVGDDPTIRFVSPTASAIFGRPPEEMVGQSAFAFTPLSNEEHIRQLSEAVGRGEPIPLRLEIPALRPDGSQLSIDVALSMIEHEGERLAVAFIQDLSHRYAALEAAARSDEQLRRVLEVAPEAVWIIGDRGVLYGNKAAVELFGFESAEQALGTDPKEILHPDDVAVFEQRALSLMLEKKALGPQEYRVRRRDGSWLTIETNSIFIEYDGVPARLSFGRDVSERKRLELSLLRADRLAALGLMARGMAHAINNPLSYVLLDLEQVAKSLPHVSKRPELLAELLARLREAYQGAGRIADVVRRMRAFSRVDERPRTTVDVRRLLDSAIELVGHEIRHRGQLDVEFADVPAVDASSAHLEQVFLHLLVHAAQSLPDGRRVLLSVRPADPGRVVVSLCIEGCAMDADALARVFDPFYVSGDGGEGSRLGLPFCRAVVTSLGGEIVAESEPEIGTTFRVFLPVGAEGEAPRSGPRRPLPEPVRRAHILVVDDDPGVGSALCTALPAHEVTCCTIPRQALERLERGEEYDIVFCDVMMPELSGPELYKAVRACRPEQAARFVFITAGASRAEVARFLESVPNRRLDKPFGLTELHRLVNELAFLGDSLI